MSIEPLEGPAGLPAFQVDELIGALDELEPLLRDLLDGVRVDRTGGEQRMDDADVLFIDEWVASRRIKSHGDLGVSE